VYDVVRRIPLGKVATYGDVAGMLGARSVARHVGWALAVCDEADVPWHRVINARGRCSGDPLHQEQQLNLIEADGLRVLENGRISLREHRWVPEVEERPTTTEEEPPETTA